MVWRIFLSLINLKVLQVLLQFQLLDEITRDHAHDGINILTQEFVIFLISLLGKSWITLVDINVVRIFCSGIKCRKNETTFWFTRFIITGNRTDCTDDIFVDFFGFPEAFVISCFERDIISIMEEIYCIIMICMVIFCNVVIKRFQKCIILRAQDLIPKRS